MQIAWRSSEAAWLSWGSTEPLTIAKPTGTAAGDVLVATVALGDSYSSQLPLIAGPAGWTLVRRIDHATVDSLLIYFHVADATEPAAYTWSSDLPAGGVGWISSYTGVDRSAPINAEAGVDSSARGTSYSTAGITTTVPNVLLIATFAGHNSGALNTWTAPVGMTSRANLNNSGSRSGTSADATQPVVGWTGPRVATASQIQDYALIELVALKPA